MILIVASAADRAAAEFAETLSVSAAVSVVTCKSLALEGTAIRHPAILSSTLTVAGKSIVAAEIEWVLNCLPAVFPEELFFYPPEEREYQSAEFHALLTSFLHWLPRPVINRPNSVSLTGSSSSPIGWYHLARKLRIPLADVHLTSTEVQTPFASLSAGDLVHATYLRGMILGSSPHLANQYARALAQASGVDFLRAAFRPAHTGLELTAVNTAPNLRERCHSPRDRRTGRGSYRMILLWGLMEDATFRSVHDHLLLRRADFAFLNHASIRRTRVEFHTKPEPAYLLHCDRTIDLDDVSAAYLRPYDHKLYEAEAADQTGSRTLSSPDLVHHLLTNWAEHTDATILNRPSAEATNQSKLYQAGFIVESGFLVPDSLVSNDSSTIADFVGRHGQVIYKSMSSVRSIVKQLDLADLPSAGPMGPALFQQRVLGTNVRVHVIGDQAIACAIESEGTDYRYASARMSPITLPRGVAARCVALTRKLGLVLSGIDLIVTPRGEYYCLEVNPSPAFGCFDIDPEHSISQSVAETLMQPAPALALPAVSQLGAQC